MRQKWTVPSLVIFLSMNVLACAMDTGLNEEGEGSYYETEESTLKKALGDDAKEIQALLLDEKNDPSATDSSLDTDVAEVDGKQVYYLRVLWGHIKHAKSGPLKPSELLPADALTDSSPPKSDAKTDAKGSDSDNRSPVFAGWEAKADKAYNRYMKYLDAKDCYDSSMKKFDAKTDANGSGTESDKPKDKTECEAKSSESQYAIEGVDCKDSTDADGTMKTACSPKGKALTAAAKKLATHWNGFIETQGGKQQTVKVVRFEPGDKVLPCIDGECVGFDTRTLGGTDGVLLRIVTHRPAVKPMDASGKTGPGMDPSDFDSVETPTDKSTQSSADAKDAKKPQPKDAKSGDAKPIAPPPAYVRVAFGNVDFDVTIPLHKLAGFNSHVVVDARGNQVVIRAFAKKPRACPNGSSRGRWIVKTDGKAFFRGPVRNEAGHRIGRMAGKLNNGKFKGAVVDLSGKLRGLVRGIYLDADGMDATTSDGIYLPADGIYTNAPNGIYRGRITNFQGETVTFVGGRWMAGKDGKGSFSGHWRAQCHADLPCNPCTDELNCVDQSDKDGPAKDLPVTECASKTQMTETN